MIWTAAHYKAMEVIKPLLKEICPEEAATLLAIEVVKHLDEVVTIECKEQ